MRTTKTDLLLRQRHANGTGKVRSNAGITASSVEETTPSATAPYEEKTMSTMTTKDGTQLYYKDWGVGRAVVFSHGWPLNADAWESQMVCLASNGYRCIAHDRRGHGRSSQPWNGNDMDTYADDLSELIEMLDLHGATLIGHSTGGGEVARYIGRHGTKRVAKAVLMGSVTPLMLKTDANPGGLPIAAFDAIRMGVAADRSQFFKDLTTLFYGANRPGAKISQGVTRRVLVAGACRAVLRTSSTASRRFPRRTSATTSRSSTCRR